MRTLSAAEELGVAGGDVVVPGRRDRFIDPLENYFVGRGAGEDGGGGGGSSFTDAGGGGGQGGGDASQPGDESRLEEVVVIAHKALADNLKVDLGKCGYPIDYLLNPPSKIDSMEAWRECFKTLTPEDRKNLADAFKELNKIITEKRLATAFTGNWIKHCIAAIESNNGGWFGQNYFDTMQSASISAVIAAGLKIVTRR